MSTYTPVKLSGSTDGKPIAIATGTAIHTAQSGTAGLDEVWLYASNVTTSPVQLTLIIGGVSVAVVKIPALCTEFPIGAGSLRLDNAAAITATAATGSALFVYGICNRITF